MERSWISARAMATRCFGRKDRFLRGIEQASDQIEEPKYRQAYIRRAVSAGVIGNVQTLLSIGTTVLVATLSLQGIIIQAALTGTGNLCSYVSSGIKEIAAHPSGGTSGFRGF